MWQPIETAPKDGTHILCAVPGEIKVHVFIIWWNNGGWCNSLTPDFITGVPTHWMPLPEPPKEGL
jgi:hypothetical protein